MEPFRIGDVTIERVVPKSKIPEPSKKRQLDEVDSDGGVNVNNDLKIFVKPPPENADGQQSSVDGGQTLQELRDKMDEMEDEESDEKMSTEEESEEDESDNEALDDLKDKATTDVDIDSLVKNKTGISIVKRESSSTDIAKAKVSESAVNEDKDGDDERTDDKVNDDKDINEAGNVQMEDEDADKEDDDDNDNEEAREETSKRKATEDGSVEGSPKPVKKKKRRKKKPKEGSGDEEKDKEESGSGSDSGSGSGSGTDNKSNVERKLSNMRRNIREVMSENQLDEETLAAQRREMERLRRVQDQQKILREVARQAALNKQNAKTQTRVISLLRGSALLRQLPGASVTPAISVGPATGPASSGSVLVKLAQPPAAASGAKKVIELLRVPQGGRSPLPRSLLTKPHMMTPSVSIAPVAPRAAATAPDLGSSSEDEDERAREALRKVAGKPKPKGRDVVTISSSSEDDCILLSEPSSEEEPEAADDPTNSGMHTNDAYNIPDESGRVLVNVGHPEADADIFLAPQIARIIKPHQIGGIRFLFDNIVESVERFESSTGFGCILAHSMGLGKTLQVVSFCDIFLRHTPSRTVLCILPINTLQNWLAEFNMWLPDKLPEGADPETLRVRDFALHVLNDSHKSVTARARVIKEWSKDGGVLLIGYELYRQFSLKRSQRIKKRPRHKQAEAVVEPEDDDKTKALLDEILASLVKPGPDLVICDEGHRIKNSHASISLALKQIKSRRRIVLTGYPLQNNLLEYWCMVDFVRPNYLGTKTEFCNMFERPIQNGQCYDSTPQDVRLMRYRAHVLHSLLEGFVQRRSQQVLQLSLPQKEEYVLLLRMMPFQRKLYDTFMNEVVRTKAVPNPLKAFAVCCKIWNHPDVLYQFLKKRAGGEAVDLDLEEATAAAAGLAAAAASGGSVVPATVGVPGRGAKRGRGRGSRGGGRKDRKGGAKPAASVTPNASSPAADATSTTGATGTVGAGASTLPSMSQMSGNSHYPGHGYGAGQYDDIGYQNQGGQTNTGPQFPGQFPSASSSSGPTGYNPDGTPYGNLNFPASSQNNYPGMTDGPQYHGNSHNAPTNPYSQYSNNPSSNFNPYYNQTGTGNRSTEFPDTSGQSGNNYWGNQNYYSGTGATGQDGTNYQNQTGFPGANSVAGNYQANPGTQSGGSFTQNPAAGSVGYGQGSFTGGQNANYPGATQNSSNYQGQGDAATNQYYDSGSGSFGNNGFFQNQGYGNYGNGNGGGDGQFRMNEPFANKTSENVGQAQANTGFGTANSGQASNVANFPNSQATGFPNSNAVGQSQAAPGTFTPGYGNQFPGSQTSQEFRPTEQKPNTLSGQTRGQETGNFPPSFNSQFPTPQDNFRSNQFGSEVENKFNDPGNIKIENLLGMDCETPSGMFGSNANAGFGNRAANMDHWGNDFDKDTKMAEVKPEKSPLDILKDEFSVDKTVSSPKSEVKATGLVVPNAPDGAKKEEVEEGKEKEGEGKEGEGSPVDIKPGEAKTAQEWMAAKNGGREDPGIPYDWAVELLKNYVPGAIENSAKMDVFFLILNESVMLGDRLLVFSQSLFTLNLIEEFLQSNKLPGSEDKWARNVNYYRLDGSTTALEREKLINEYNSNPGVHLFLVSTRAGSLGINLVGANRVIVFDASWNPCHDTQAVCRVYRYGQQKPCFVYRLVMDNCLEKKIYDRQINKQGMADRVVDECNPDAHLSIKEVTNLCWDDEKDTEIADFSEGKDKYEDLVMRKLVETHSRHLSKEPFQHESLLVDRKEKKLSQAEKRLAQRSYELEKQANINYNRPQYPVTQPGLQIRAIRPDGSAAGKPVASVRPMQAEPGQSGGVRGAALGAGAGRTRWIPAEVWQRQGMSAQEMTLPLDVVIPTNSADRASIVLKAGQRVMVLKSPKGIYMQLENGKIIAIRTAFKVGGAGKGAPQDNTKDLKATSFLHQDKDDLKKGNVSITRGPKPPAPPLKAGPAVSLMAKSPSGRLGPALARRPLLSRPRPPAAATKPYRPNDDDPAAKDEGADSAKSPGSSQDTARSVEDADSETSFDGEAAAKAAEKPEEDFRTDMQKLQANVDKIQPDPSFQEEGKEEKRLPDLKKFTVERTFQKSGLPAVSVTPVSTAQNTNLPPTNIQQWQQKNPQYIQQAYQHAPSATSVNPSTQTAVSLGPVSQPASGQNQSGYPRPTFNQSTFKNQGQGNIDQQMRIPMPDQQMRIPDQQMRPPDQHMRIPDQQMRPPEQQMRIPDQQMRPPEQQIRIPDQQMRPPDQQMRPPDQQMRIPDQQMRLSEQQMRPQEQQMRIPDQQMRVPDQQLRIPDQQMRLPESQLPHESQQRIPESHTGQLRIPDASMRQRESQMRLHDAKTRPHESQMRLQESQTRIPDLTSPIPVESSDEERRNSEAAGATLSPRSSLKNYRHNFTHKGTEKPEAPDIVQPEKPRHVPNLTPRPTKKRPPPKSKTSAPVDYQALGATEEKPVEPPAYHGFQQGYPGFPGYPGFAGQFPNEFQHPAAAYAAEKLPEISLTRPDPLQKKSEKDAKEPDTEKRKDDSSSRISTTQPDTNPYASGYPQYPGQMSAPYDSMMNGYPGQYPAAAANPFAANFRPGNPYGAGYPLAAGYPTAPTPTYGEDYARAGMYSAFHRPEPHFPNPSEIPSPFGQPFMPHHRFPGTAGTQPTGYFPQNAYPPTGFAARPGFPPETGYGYQAAAAGFNPYMAGHVPMRYPGIPGAAQNATMPPQ